MRLGVGDGYYAPLGFVEPTDYRAATAHGFPATRCGLNARGLVDPDAPPVDDDAEPQPEPAERDGE